MTTKEVQRQIVAYDDVEWLVPGADGTETSPGPNDAVRKRLIQGDGGFYTQIVRLPAGFTAPAHSHDHAEVFMVLSGSCVFDGQAMGERDSTVVAADQAYTFTAGDEGLEFLIVRPGVAAFRAVR